MDPFNVLARSIAAKSDLRLTQVTVVSATGGIATVTYRGSNVAGVPYTGSEPADGALVWMLVDTGQMVLLT